MSGIRVLVGRGRIRGSIGLLDFSFGFAFGLPLETSPLGSSLFAGFTFFFCIGAYKWP